MFLTSALPSVLAQVPAGQTWWDGGSPLASWAVQFLVTLALELPMVLVAWRFLGCVDRLRPWLLGCIVGNLVSHPAAVFLGTSFHLVDARGFFAVGTYIAIETGAILLEAWFFRLMATTSWMRAMVVALAANAITALLGAQMLFGAA